jgi:hypothetical protein
MAVELALADQLLPCFGLRDFPNCSYDPSKPFSIYFSLGEAIGALAFTLTVQQLLKPIYRFRLTARHFSLARLYSIVFAGVAAIFFATFLPALPALHSTPWGYAITWELTGAALFASAYAAVVIAIIRPVRVRSKGIVDFAQLAASLLSSADEQDHIDFAVDLKASLPRLMKASQFLEFRGETSAFFDFTFRKEIERAAYAISFLHIVADPKLCETLVKRSPWLVVYMLRNVSERKLRSEGAAQFIRQIARQAILRDDGMMAREVGYHGFGTAPLLSETLFSDTFIIETFDPFDFQIDNRLITPELMTRFNSASERCYDALIENGIIYYSQACYRIKEFYRNAFMRAPEFQSQTQYDWHLPLTLHYGVEQAIKAATKLLESVSPDSYQRLYVDDPKAHRNDVLETLVEIVYEALAGIANKFEGFADPFWMTAIGVFSDAFPSFGDEPDGLNPFQQRLALKIMKKLGDNMNGFYPAISRVLFACVGPYHHNVVQPNATAFNILKDAMYFELQKLPNLATSKPEEIGNYFPRNVKLDPTSSILIHDRDSGVRMTDLLQFDLAPVSLVDVNIRSPQPRRTQG